jgi:crossover junction endodeoxyribonuclease RuvC
MEKPKAWIGIDPGASGAACLLVDDRVEFYDWQDVWASALVINQWIFDVDYTVVGAVIERVSSMPKQGVASSFKFGDNFGCWKGIIAAFGIPCHLPTPRKWQNGLILPSDGPDPKSRSLAVARRLFPQCADDLKRKKDNGRSDALLMAHWGRLQG